MGVMAYTRPPLGGPKHGPSVKTTISCDIRRRPNFFINEPIQVLFDSVIGGPMLYKMPTCSSSKIFVTRVFWRLRNHTFDGHISGLEQDRDNLKPLLRTKSPMPYRLVPLPCRSRDHTTSGLAFLAFWVIKTVGNEGSDVPGRRTCQKLGHRGPRTGGHGVARVDSDHAECQSLFTLSSVIIVHICNLLSSVIQKGFGQTGRPCCFNRRRRQGACRRTDRLHLSQNWLRTVVEPRTAAPELRGLLCALSGDVSSGPSSILRNLS